MYSKLSILLLLFSLGYSASAQQLSKGKYRLSTGFTNTEFNFKEKSRFSYEYRSCTGGQEGTGTYSLEGKELVLTFENPEGKLVPKRPVIERRETTGDSSFLNFRFFDQKDDSPVDGVTIEFKDKLSDKLFGTISNSIGQATLRINNSQLPLVFEIRYLGIEPKTITIDSSGDYTIAYPLNFEYMQILAKGDILKFTIDNYNKAILVLKPIDAKEFRTFTRKH